MLGPPTCSCRQPRGALILRDPNSPMTSDALKGPIVVVGPTQGGVLSPGGFPVHQPPGPALSPLSSSEGQLHGEPQHRGLTVHEESSELRGWKLGDPTSLCLRLCSPSNGTERVLFPMALATGGTLGVHRNDQDPVQGPEMELGLPRRWEAGLSYLRQAWESQDRMAPGHVCPGNGGEQVKRWGLF